MAWTCKTCGKEHDDVPLSFAADYPDSYFKLSSEERELRGTIGTDQCIVGEEEFYLRGCLEIPIRNSDDIFLWGLWARIWEEDYDEISNCWDEEGRELRHGPFKGRLNNALKEYSPSTLNLKLTVKLQPLGKRPLFFIDEPDHPLAIAQKHGMTREEAQELVGLVLHNS